MNCRKMRIDIIALLDESLGEVPASRIRQHLQSCPACLHFYEEQRNLDRLLKSEPQLDLPVQIWEGIESRLLSRPAPAPPLRWLGTLFEWANFRYAFASAILLVIVSVAVFRVTVTPRPEDEQLLAEIRAYQVEVQGNPFLKEIGRENPFYAFSLRGGKNPFNSVRSTK
jgi:predicted anti-sigma-YlaC factor YlaD